MLLKESNEKAQKKAKGQISVLIAIMMSTFILFFAFVINIGMLVNAKINLQNAADLAAYAGAAVQARQLTHIAYLNYEMRRQFKKFLYRIYVLGNMSQDSFPTSGAGAGSLQSTPAMYSPTGSPSDNYGAPTTCVIFSSNDNFCHVTVLPAIQIPPPNALDAITSTLSGTLTQAEAIRENNCLAIGTTNLFLNIYWLFNTDPKLTNIGSLDTLQKNTVSILTSLATGLGIVPKELLLSQRIQTLEDYVNLPPSTNINLDTIQGLNKNAPYNERTIQAFYSAYYTLGNHTFSGSNISLDELTPASQGTQGGPLLKLNPIQTKFDTYSIDLTLGDSEVGDTSNLNNLANNTGNDCKKVLDLTTLPSPLTVGYSKDPSVLTYYAVRLTAQAQLLFSPFGTVTLRAYSAAQPFGSRIGPANPLFSTQSPAGLNQRDATASPAEQLPNLAVRQGESIGTQGGWNTMEVLGQMYQALGASGTTDSSIGRDMIENAYQIAMAPNPSEIGQYTIIGDFPSSNFPSGDPFVHNFDERNTSPDTHQMVATLWAPITAPGKTYAKTDNLATDIISNFFTPTNIKGNLGAGPNQGQNLARILGDDGVMATSLVSYLDSMKTGQGENGEGENVVPITNPFVDLHNNPINPLMMLTLDASDIKTSWNTNNRSDFFKAGRSGYSVKFVAFQSLLSGSISTNGSTNFSNLLSPDPQSSADGMETFQH